MELTLSNFFFYTPLYTRVEVSANDTSFLRQVFGERKKDFDGFNPFTKLESTFKINSNLLRHDDIFLETGGFNTIVVQCKRSDDYFEFYILWRPKDNSLIKVGQFPTVADFQIGEIKQYKKLLPENKLKELTRATGLAANGIGIGSFVYLRRIFEHLINESYLEAKAAGDIVDSEFKKSRMDQKIDLLSDYLPQFLVENKDMYSILSLGIHELDEQTCLNHFEAVKVAIEIILDEKLDELKKKEKIEAAKKKLKSVKNEVSNTSKAK